MALVFLYFNPEPINVIRGSMICPHCNKETYKKLRDKRRICANCGRRIIIRPNPRKCLYVTVGTK